MTEHSLMNTLLAYSASHRAALLGHPESRRVVTYLANANRLLQHALQDPKRAYSPAIVTVPLLMASMNITCHITSEPAPLHVTAAKDLLKMIRPSLSRTEPATLDFIERWVVLLEFATGTLDNESLKGLTFLRPDLFSTRIDSLWGLTDSGMTTLAWVHRLSHSKNSIFWAPSARMEFSARIVEQDLTNGAYQLKHDSCCELEKDTMVAINQAFHWAGMIKLHRSALRTPYSHPDVQSLVLKVVDTLRTVDENSTSKIALLFPLIAAGFAALRPMDRELVLDQFFELELLGFSSVWRQDSHLY